jgi:hypothetical protein
MRLARYKKYGTGGNPDLAMGIGEGAAIVGQMSSVFGQPNRYGKSSLTSNVLGNAGNLAAAGAAFGPWGAAVGGAAGLVTGLLKNGAQRKQEDRIKQQERDQQQQQDQQQSAATLAGNPNALTGFKGVSYYAAGGPLAAGYLNKSQGGTAKPLSSTATEIQGPSHTDGGVKFPDAGAELEGGETTDGSYVFSKQLGFAQVHKPIARAIGKIEGKVMSPERINSLKLLREKENQLKTSQEFVRKLYKLPNHA